MRSCCPGVLLVGSAVLVLSVCLTAARATMRLPALEGRSGSTVDVPISIVGATGIGALQLEIIFDAKVLKPDAVTGGPLANNALVEFNAESQGRLAVGVATAQVLKGDGVVATARFSVIGQPGQTSALTIRNAEAWEGATSDPILITTEDGKLTVVGGSPPWLLWVAIALAVLFGLLLLFFLSRRRKKEPAAAVPAAPAAQRAGPYCSACGSLNEPDSTFCGTCGKQL